MGRAALRSEEFIAAAEKGDVERLRRLLDGGVKVDVRDSRLGPGWTALMAAAGRGRTEAFELLLQRGADPHATDDDGNTLLHHAACGGKEPILRALLERGLDVNGRNRGGYTPLILAAMDERIRAVRCLLAAGADVNVQTTDQYGITALKASHPNEKIAALLQRAGARLDPRQEQVVAQACARVAGVSAAAEPAQFDQPEIQAFVQAAAQGQLDQVRDLLAAGMPVNARGQHGTALEFAAANGQLEVVRTLLDAGADLEAASTGWPILIYAANGGHVEIVRLLLDRGEDPNRAGEAGITPLMGAALKGAAPAVRLLLDAGANPHTRSSWMLAPGKTKTALDFAQDNRKKEVIPLLAAAMGIAAADVAEDSAYAAAKQFRHNAETPAFQAVLARLAEACGKPPIPWEKRKGVYRCYLRHPAAGQLEALQAEVRAAGFQLVLYDAIPGYDNAAKLMVFPTSEKYAVLVARGTNGANYDLTTRALIAWLRDLEKENPFELIGCGFDFLEGSFPSHVQNAKDWSRRMLELCPDCESAAQVMLELRQQRFYFWWD